MTKVWKRRMWIETPSLENIKSIVDTFQESKSRAQLVLEVEEEDGNGLWYWHIHHDALVEKATEPIQNRIDAIKSSKPDYELRLKLLKQVKNQDLLNEFAELRLKYPNAYLHSPAIIKLHKEECPNCPWTVTRIQI